MSETTTPAPELDGVVEAAMTRWGVPGLTLGILRDREAETRAYGVASLESGYPLRPDSLFQIGSISKVYTATLVMTFVEEGVLDLDTPVSTYLPDLVLADAAARDAITVRHLLAHTSGLEGDRFTDYGMGDDALTRAIAEFHTLRQITPPGETWAYCNSGFYLTGAIIERLTGKPFEAVMRERVFEPLGLTRSFFFAHEAITYPVAVGHSPVQPGEPAHEVARRYPLPRCVNAAGGIISDVGDLLRFAAFHLGDGTVDGKRVLSPESLAAMRAPQAEAGSFAEAYGLAWALHAYDGGWVVGHGGTTGGFQAQLRLVPGRGFAVAVLTNSSQGAAAYSEIIDWVLEHECGLRPVRPEPVSLSADELAWFAGRYHRPDVDITISVDWDRLRADVVTRSQLTGKETTLPPLTLIPIGERRFLIADTHVRGETVEFLEGPDGAPRFLRFHGRLADWQGR